MHNLPDTALTQLARDGDSVAFAELYSRYFDPVLAFAATITRDRDEAADVAQDAFLKAMNGLASLRDGASFRCWLFSIARNTALNRAKRGARFRPLPAGCPESAPWNDVADPDRFVDPQEAAEANAAAALVWEAAAGLEPLQASILALHLRRGMDCAEIAAELGISRNYASVMLNRLKKSFADSLSALLVLRKGRGACRDLDWALAEGGVRALSPRARAVIREHAAHCLRCSALRTSSADTCVGRPVALPSRSRAMAA